MILESLGYLAQVSPLNCFSLFLPDLALHYGLFAHLHTSRIFSLQALQRLPEFNRDASFYIQAEFLVVKQVTVAVTVYSPKIYTSQRFEIRKSNESPVLQSLPSCLKLAFVTCRAQGQRGGGEDQRGGETE